MDAVVTDGQPSAVVRSHDPAPAVPDRPLSPSSCIGALWTSTGRGSAAAPPKGETPKDMLHPPRWVRNPAVAYRCRFRPRAWLVPVAASAAAATAIASRTPQGCSSQGGRLAGEGGMVAGHSPVAGHDPGDRAAAGTGCGGPAPELASAGEVRPHRPWTRRRGTGASRCTTTSPGRTASRSWRAPHGTSLEGAKLL